MGVAVAVAVAVGMLGLGGLAWVFLAPGKDGPGPAAGTSYAFTPDARGTVALSEIDTPLELQPLGGQGVAVDSGLAVFAVHAGESDLLVAMDSEAVGRPVWERKLEGGLDQCSLIPEGIDCGEAGTFSWVTGDDVASEKSSSSATEGPGDEGDEADGEDEGEGGGKNEAGGENEDADETKPDIAEDSESVGSLDSAPQPQPVPTKAGEEAAYWLDGKTLVGANGQQLVAFGSGSVWQVSDSTSGADISVFTDGGVVAAVRGGEVVWELVLPDGSQEVNTQADGVAITVGGPVVVIGEPSGLMGVDIEDGEEVWRIDGSVDSWFARGDTLMVAGAGDVHLLQFPSDSPDADDAGGKRTLEAADLPQPPTYESLANGELQIPQEMREMLELSSDRIQMTNGEYDADVSGGHFAGFVGLQEVAPLFVDSDAYGLAVMLYGIRNSDRYDVVWSIYDPQGNLVAWDSTSYIPGIMDTYMLVRETASGWQAGVWVEDVRGGEFTLGFGWNKDRLSDRSGVEIWEFDGSKAVLKDLILDLPDGRSSMPVQEKVQEAYDLLAASNDREAAKYTTSEMLNYVQNAFFGDGTGPDSSVRHVAFERGGKVDQCILANPSFEPMYPLQDANGVQYGGLAQPVSLEDRVPVGMWFCAVKTSILDTSTFSGATHHHLYLAVTTDEDGNPTIESLGRNFA